MSLDLRVRLRAVAGGSHAAFAGLYDELGGETYAVCRGAAATSAAADSLQTEIWLAVWRHAMALEQFPGEVAPAVMSLAFGVVRRSGRSIDVAYDQLVSAAS